jgi:hypothetical protein
MASRLLLAALVGMALGTCGSSFSREEIQTQFGTLSVSLGPSSRALALPQRRNSQPLRQTAVLEAALHLRQSLSNTMFPSADGLSRCTNHTVLVDVAALSGSAFSSQDEAVSLLQTAARIQTGFGPVATRPAAQCSCEEYACTCSKQCACKLTGDGGAKLEKKLNARMTAQEIMGNPGPRGLKPSVVDYSFRCGCEFDVQQSSVGGSGGGEEGFGLATADGSLRCACGLGDCQCRRVCKCSTGDGPPPALLQTGSDSPTEEMLQMGAGNPKAVKLPTYKKQPARKLRKQAKDKNPMALPEVKVPPPPEPPFGLEAGKGPGSKLAAKGGAGKDSTPKDWPPPEAKPELVGHSFRQLAGICADCPPRHTALQLVI